MPITSLSRVDILPLSHRAVRAVKQDNIVFVGDLIQKTRDELMQANMVGPVTADEIEAELAKHGLALGTFDPAWPAKIELALAA